MILFFGDLVDIREYDKYKDTESLDAVVENSDLLFLCLPTPMNEDGSCNISIIETVMKEINEITQERKLIVFKSTVPPGTTEKFQRKYSAFDFCFNPEFLTQAKHIENFINQDRIIIGWAGKPSASSFELMNDLYKCFVENQKKPATLLWNGNSREAEMCKYIANCFLATKVAFFNEMYEICKNAKINFEIATKLASSDSRIGSSHTKVPGPDGQFGYGGACFVKDTNALICFAKENNIDPIILESMWTKNLLIREIHEWEKLAQVNGKYKKNE